MKEHAEILRRLDNFANIQHELEEILQTLVLNDSTIIDALAQMFGVIGQVSARAERIERSQARSADDIRSLVAAVAALQPASAAGGPILSKLDEFGRENPEIALLQFLCAFLDERTAVDVGAHTGEVAARLLQSGYRVHAFEPFPSSYETLQARFAANDAFTARPVAIGAGDYDGSLHVARYTNGARSQPPSLFNSLIEHPLGTAIEFSDTLPVRVRSLASLKASGELPAHIGVLKIDSEGNDLDVIRGMGAPDYEVVMAEYWDAEHIFGQAGHGLLAPIVETMRERGFSWHVVIYHLDEEGVISYHFNHQYTIRKSWGNAIFFRDRALFGRAAQWCEAVLGHAVQHR